MVDRHLLGDIALAVVLVLPTAALARTESARILHEQPRAAAVHSADVRAPVSGRIALLG